MYWTDHKNSCHFNANQQKTSPHSSVLVAEHQELHAPNLEVAHQVRPPDVVTPLATSLHDEDIPFALRILLLHLLTDEGGHVRELQWPTTEPPNCLDCQPLHLLCWNTIKAKKKTNQQERQDEDRKAEKALGSSYTPMHSCKSPQASR